MHEEEKEEMDGGLGQILEAKVEHGHQSAHHDLVFENGAEVVDAKGVQHCRQHHVFTDHANLRVSFDLRLSMGQIGFQLHQRKEDVSGVNQLQANEHGHGDRHIVYVAFLHQGQETHAQVGVHSGHLPEE